MMINPVEVQVGPESILSYKRLSYKRHFALAEMIDNSVSSYLLNKSALDEDWGSRSGKPLRVIIAYDRENSTLRVTDNAMGMDEAEIVRAMTIARPAAPNSARHEYGMGLKTSACWLGDYWEVTTTKLGSPFEYRISFDVNRVAAGETILPIQVTDVSADSHYTVVEISKLHQQITGRAAKSAKDNLASIFRLDTRDFMQLLWGEEELQYDLDLPFLLAANGQPYRRNFSFEIGDKPVQGWIGILEKGGRSIAGFAQVRKGRVVRGQPDAWKPLGIFGSAEEGANNLVSQRIVGELHFSDSFNVSHTKDAILFENDDEDALTEALLEEYRDYLEVAKSRRKRSGGGPTDAATSTALQVFESLVSSASFEDRVIADPIPTEEMIRIANDHVAQTIKSREADRQFQIGAFTIQIFVSADLSPSDPYYVGDFPDPETICVVVNTQHPFWQDNVLDTQDILIYLLNCAFDAIAEFKCMRMSAPISPETVRSIKDGFMRVPVE